MSIQGTKSGAIVLLHKHALFFKADSNITVFASTVTQPHYTRTVDGTAMFMVYTSTVTLVLQVSMCLSATSHVLLVWIESRQFQPYPSATKMPCCPEFGSLSHIS